MSTRPNSLVLRSTIAILLLLGHHTSAGQLSAESSKYPVSNSNYFAQNPYNPSSLEENMRSKRPSYSADRAQPAPMQGNKNYGGWSNPPTTQPTPYNQPLSIVTGSGVGSNSGYQQQLQGLLSGTRRGSGQSSSSQGQSGTLPLYNSAIKYRDIQPRPAPQPQNQLFPNNNQWAQLQPNNLNTQLLWPSRNSYQLNPSAVRGQGQQNLWTPKPNQQWPPQQQVRMPWTNPSPQAPGQLQGQGQYNPASATKSTKASFPPILPAMIQGKRVYIPLYNDPKRLPSFQSIQPGKKSSSFVSIIHGFEKKDAVPQYGYAVFTDKMPVFNPNPANTPVIAPGTNFGRFPPPPSYIPPQNNFPSQNLGQQFLPNPAENMNQWNNQIRTQHPPQFRDVAQMQMRGTGSPGSAFAAGPVNYYGQRSGHNIQEVGAGQPTVSQSSQFLPSPNHHPSYVFRQPEGRKQPQQRGMGYGTIATGFDSQAQKHSAVPEKNTWSTPGYYPSQRQGDSYSRLPAQQQAPNPLGSQSNMAKSVPWSQGQGAGNPIQRYSPGPPHANYPSPKGYNSGSPGPAPNQIEYDGQPGSGSRTIINGVMGNGGYYTTVAPGWQKSNNTIPQPGPARQSYVPPTTAVRKGSSQANPRPETTKSPVLPLPRRPVSFYSQADVDSHYRRMLAHNETAADNEFENDAGLLQYDIQRSKQILREHPLPRPTVVHYSPGEYNAQFHTKSAPTQSDGISSISDVQSGQSVSGGSMGAGNGERVDGPRWDGGTVPETSPGTGQSSGNNGGRTVSVESGPESEFLHPLGSSQFRRRRASSTFVEEILNFPELGF